MPQYEISVRFWGDCASSSPKKEESKTSPDWLGIARRCRDDLLVLGRNSDGSRNGGTAFLILNEENAKQDPTGGGEVAFRRRSHRCADNFRCRASWEFVVVGKDSATFSATAWAPTSNDRARIAKDEYIFHLEKS